MNDNILSKFGDNVTVAVIGASGGIGCAFLEHLSAQPNVTQINAFSRSKPAFDHTKIEYSALDITAEDTIKTAIDTLDDNTLFDIVIVATGILHDETTTPEKTIRDLNLDTFQKIFAINTFGPALIAKHFLPRLRRDRRSVFACLSARVGSITDNQLGGWYAYRASKTALNMLLKNAAIETSRRYKEACIIGLHPGTVDTALSEPFQSNVKEGKLFTPAYSSEKLLNIINNVNPPQSRKIFAWDGQEIPA
jgi:NAD(P)-dependent dehydrogenase (short-subunit alcohol dehydrogenase family)